MHGPSISPAQRRTIRNDVQLQVISKSETHHAGALGPVLLTYWRAAPTVEVIRSRRQWFADGLTKYEAFGLLIVVEGNTGFTLPNLAFARESRSQLQLIRERPGFGGLVVEGTGVVRSLVRTFTRGQGRATKGAHHNKSFLSAEGASNWIGARLAPWDGPSGAEIFNAANALRALPYDTL
jgi:hypothetical protein